MMLNTTTGSKKYEFLAVRYLFGRRAESYMNSTVNCLCVCAFEAQTVLAAGIGVCGSNCLSREHTQT